MQQQQAKAQAQAAAPTEAAAAPASSSSSALASTTSASAPHRTIFDTRITFPRAYLSGVGPAVSTALRSLLPMVPGTLLVKYAGPLRDEIDASPPTLGELVTVAAALLIASFGKIFVTLTMVWNYPVSYLRMLVLFTLTSHTTALQAVADCSVVDAISLVLGGYIGLLVVRGILVAAGVVASFHLL